MDFMGEYKWGTPISLNHIVYKKNHYYYNDPILLKQPGGKIFKDKYLKQIAPNKLQDIYTRETFKWELAPVKSNIICHWKQIEEADDFYTCIIPMYDLENNLEVERMFRKEHYYNFKVYIKDNLNNYLASLLAVSLSVTLMNLCPGLWKAVFAGDSFDFIIICFVMATSSVLFWVLIKLAIFNEDL